MKRLTKLSVIFICSLAVTDWPTLADLAPTNTNLVFVSTDGTMLSDEKGNLSIPPEVLEAARSSPECRPAEEDIEGHWGAPSEGFLLSVRIPAKRYEQGERIVATVIIRNITQTNELSFVQEFASGSLSRIHLYDEHTNLVKRTDIPETPTFEEKLARLVTSPKQRFVGPRTQIKWEMELNGCFDLSEPGKRLLQAVQTIPSLDRKTNTVVTSGLASFEIVSPGK